MRRQPLDDLFAPRAVAVVGATEAPASAGRLVLSNLLQSPFGGTVYPVSPGRASVLGVRAYERLADLPERPDLAVIVTPASAVPDVVGDCAASGVRAAVVISDGFREIGADGVALERATLEAAERGSVRLLGPNSLGVMRPPVGLNASMATAVARPGTVALLSQSGAIASAVLDWASRENVGFSAFVSVGGMLDVGWGELIDHLGHDEHTRSIVLYMESVGPARPFMSAAREVALTKPIIVMKAGRTEAAARAAGSHAGALTGRDEVVDAAFRRCGVLRVATIAELFYMAEALSKQPRPRGPRLAIVTNAGGPGVLAADALLAHGGALAELSDESLAALDALLPAHWSRHNPVDILGDADPARYAAAVQTVVGDPASDGILVILAPQPATDATATAEVLGAAGRQPGKPVLASWMGGAQVAAGEALLNRADVPTFPFPDTAARVFTHMWRYSHHLRALYETPTLPPGLAAGEAIGEATAEGLQRVRDTGRTWLTTIESLEVLARYGIDVVRTRLAATADLAAEAAAAMGFPVAVKRHREGVPHEPDAGGVVFDVRDRAAVREAFRHIEGTAAAHPGEGAFVGVTIQPMVTADGCDVRLDSDVDAQFGPVVGFGAGGRLAEVRYDRSLALPPLTTTLARRLMEQTGIGQALVSRTVCPAVDLTALEQVLVRFSYLVAEQRLVREVDINPLLVTASRIVVLDARVRLHDPDRSLGDITPPAIRPYPTRYVGPFVLKNGTAVLIRPIRPEDEPLMVHFHETLSDRSVYFRFFHTITLGQRVSHDRLSRICFIDYDRDMALVAEAPAEAERRIVGVGRLTKERGRPAGEFAIVVTDEMQGQGLGTELLRRLVQVGRDEGLERIWGDILPENREMQIVSERLGFSCGFDETTGTVRADLLL